MNNYCLYISKEMTKHAWKRCMIPVSHLWRHVVQGPHPHLHLFFIHVHCQAEIAQLQTPFRGEENILWLDVSVFNVTKAQWDLSNHLNPMLFCLSR